MVQYERVGDNILSTVTVEDKKFISAKDILYAAGYKNPDSAISSGSTSPISKIKSSKVLIGGRREPFWDKWAFRRFLQLGDRKKLDSRLAAMVKILEKLDGNIGVTIETSKVDITNKVRKFFGGDVISFYYKDSKVATKCWEVVETEDDVFMIKVNKKKKGFPVLYFKPEELMRSTGTGEGYYD